MKTAMKTQCWFVALGLAISITAFAQVEQAWVAHCTNGAGALAMKVSSAGNVHVTGPVGTVKYDAGGDQIYVETENSVYLLTFRAEPLREMPHALAAVSSSRQRKG